MKKSRYIWVSGLAAGLVVISPWMFSLLSDQTNNDQVSMEVPGYASMIIALLIIFFGLRKTRSAFYTGCFTFRRGFYYGLTAVIIASTMYVVGWEIYYPSYKDQFMVDYQESVIEQYKAQGLTNAEIEVRKEELIAWMNYYQNPFIRMGLTFMEFFPIALIFVLLSAYILKSTKSNNSS